MSATVSQLVNLLLLSTLPSGSVALLLGTSPSSLDASLKEAFQRSVVRQTTNLRKAQIAASHRECSATLEPLNFDSVRSTASVQCAHPAQCKTTYKISGVKTSAIGKCKHLLFPTFKFVGDVRFSFIIGCAVKNSSDDVTPLERGLCAADMFGCLYSKLGQLDAQLTKAPEGVRNWFDKALKSEFEFCPFVIPTSLKVVNTDHTARLKTVQKLYKCLAMPEVTVELTSDEVLRHTYINAVSSTFGTVHKISRVTTSVSASSNCFSGLVEFSLHVACDSQDGCDLPLSGNSVGNYSKTAFKAHHCNVEIRDTSHEFLRGQTDFIAMFNPVVSQALCPKISQGVVKLLNAEAEPAKHVSKVFPA